MVLFAIILGSLALLAVIANSALMIRERKRSQKRNAAQINYADAAIQSFQAELWPRLAQIEARIKALENGTVPDYEKAKAAASAVNEFNAGITGILGFDPYDALRRTRDEGTGGEDT